jgi:folate-dependent phosphoribosylglycinamide formyltransferase PurN
MNEQAGSAQKRTPVRVGILLNSYNLNYPYYHILELLHNSGYAELCLVVLNESKKEKRKLTIGKLFKNINILFYYAYEIIDRKLFKSKVNVLRRVNASKLIEKIPVIRVKPVTTKNIFQHFEAADIEQIRQYKIDVFVRMGFKILKGDILSVSRYGILSYHHGDNKVNRGGPAGFWEMYHANPVTGTVVQVLGNDLDNGKVVYRSFTATHKYSLHQSRNNMYAKAMHFIPRVIQQLYDKGELPEVQENDFPSMYIHPLYTTPRNLQVFLFGLMMSIKSVHKFFRQLFFRNQWFLMYSLSKSEHLQTSMRKMKKILPPNGKFWADPHVIFRDGIYNVFLEEKEAGKKAHISLIRILENGSILPVIKILEQPYHLSYPFVFTNNGVDYMIPETRSNKTIELYRCESFPEKWVLEKVLMRNIMAVDCTLHFHENLWWMFVNIKEHEAASNNDELHIFYAVSPDGEWSSHKNNPVISDVRRARPAGKVFKYNNRFYRPSQDCSVTYGYGIRINEILILNENEYVEKETEFIEPLWDKGIRGVHSFVYENKLTMIDGFRKVPFWK